MMRNVSMSLNISKHDKISTNVDQSDMQLELIGTHVETTVENIFENIMTDLDRSRSMNYHCKSMRNNRIYSSRNMLFFFSLDYIKNKTKQNSKQINSLSFCSLSVFYLRRLDIA